MEENLILKVESQGAAQATNDLKALDAVAVATESILAGLTATSTALNGAMAVLSGAILNNVAATQALTSSNVVGVAATEASTAAIIAQTAALAGLTATLVADQTVRTTDTAATAANTTAVAANTTMLNANMVVTEANVIATEAQTVALAMATAATQAQTVASATETSALTANTAALVANTAALTAMSTASTGAATATGAASAAAATTSTTMRGAAAGTGIFSASLRVLMTTLAPVVALLTAMLAPIYIFKRLVEGTRTYQDFQAQLEVVTGSADKARQAYSALVDYAIQTPYGLKQATDGFVKLVNFGLDPSERAMRSLGNIASGTAKEFDQMVQATAMATVNHFVRLKQFGILARKAGDEVIFTFQGVTTKVKANAKEIQGYLLNLGETAFAGAMERRMQSLSGVMSNLADAWSLFWQAVAKTGPDATLTKIFKSIEGGLKEATAQLESGQFAASVDAWMIKWRSFFTLYNTIQQGIRDGFQFTIDFIVSQTDKLGLDWAYIWEYLPIIAEKNIKLIGNQIAYWYEMAVTYVQKWVLDFFTAYDQIVGYGTVLIDAFKSVWNSIKAAFDPMISWMLQQWDKLVTFVSGICESIKTVWEIVYNYISNVATRIVDWFVIKFEQLVGYAKVAGQAVSDAFDLKMPDVGAGFKAVTDAAAKAMENATESARAGMEKIKGELDKVTNSAQGRYAAAESAAAAQAQLAAKALLASNGVVNEAYNKHIAEYNAAKQHAEDLRKKYEADIAGRRDGKDRLAEFEKTGNGEGYNGAASSGGGGGSAGRAVREAENAAKQQLEARMRILESGMEYETTWTSQRIAESYEEQKKIILESTETSMAEKEALLMVAMNDSLVTEEEAVRMSYDRRREIILQATELTEKERSELLTKLSKARDNAISTMEDKTFEKRQTATREFFGNLAAIGEAFGKKGFEISKAAAIAEITVTTAIAAMKAYEEGGTYLGPVFAAAAIAAGAAQIAVVSQTQYQGAYEKGGYIPGGKYGVVGEAGAEIVHGPAVVTSAATTRNNGSLTTSGSVTIHNYGSPVEAQVTRNDGDLMIILKPLLDENKRRTKEEIATEMRRGNGVVTKAMESTFGVSRAQTPRA